MVLPPAIQALMHSPPAGTPEQQVHQAAAAAAAAAAVMSSPYSTYSTMMLPPSIIPLGALSCYPQPGCISTSSLYVGVGNCGVLVAVNEEEGEVLRDASSTSSPSLRTFFKRP